MNCYRKLLNGQAMLTYVPQLNRTYGSTCPSAIA